MKKEYVELDCSVIHFDSNDVIQASNPLSSFEIKRDGSVADLNFTDFWN